MAWLTDPTGGGRGHTAKFAALVVALQTSVSPSTAWRYLPACL